MAEAWEAAPLVGQAGANPSQVGTPLSAPLDQQEAWEAAPLVPKPPPTSPAESANIYDRLTAVAQGYHAGTQGLQMAPDEAQWRYREMQEQGLNPNEVVLRNPETNQQAVYLRNPDVERMSTPVLSQLQGIGEVAGPYMLPTEVPPVVGAMRSLSDKQRLFQDYQTLGIRALPPAISPEGAPALASQGLLRMPFAGPPIRAAIGNTAGDTAAAAERLAGSYGEARIPEEAGETLQKGISGFAKGEAQAGMTPSDIISAPTWATSAEAKAKALYDRADSLIDQDAQIPLPDTLGALRGPMERFPSSEKLGSLLTNPRLRSYADAIGEAGGSLTVPEARELRTYIGSMMRDTGLRGDVPLGDVKTAYGALTNDLRTNAAAQGPDALQAFDRATQYYRASGQRLEQIESLVGGSLEQTFAKVNAAAGKGKSANAGLLQSLKRSMPPDEWNDVGATVISQMGKPTPSASNVLSKANFSPTSFATNWSKISDAAKDSLFGETVPGSNRDALESLVRVAGGQENLQKLANVSHSGELTVGGLGALEVARELWHSGLSPRLVLSAIGAGIGANATSRALMSPGFARWLYGLPSLAQGAIPGQGAQRIAQSLAMMSRGNSDMAAVAPAITNILGLSASPTSSTAPTR